MSVMQSGAMPILWTTLNRWPELTTETMNMSRSILLLRSVNGAIVLIQLGSVLKSMAHVTNEGHVDVYGLCCSLKLC